MWKDIHNFLEVKWIQAPKKAYAHLYRLKTLRVLQYYKKRFPH